MDLDVVMKGNKKKTIAADSKTLKQQFFKLQQPSVSPEDEETDDSVDIEEDEEESSPKPEIKKAASVTTAKSAGKSYGIDK